MKGLVFSFGHSQHNSKNKMHHTVRINPDDVYFFFRKYGLMCIMFVLLFVGLVFGSIYAQSADKPMLKSLDFLFSTNFDTRLSQNFAETFCACFVSDFIFLATIYLLGFAPWGVPVMPFVVLFRGFGTGLTAGYLFSVFSFKGIGFYLLVILPGTFLFCLALVTLTNSSIKFSKMMFFLTIGKNTTNRSLFENTKKYSSKAMSMLIMIFLASAIDTILWTLFASAFNF